MRQPLSFVRPLLAVIALAACVRVPGIGNPPRPGETDTLVVPRTPRGTTPTPLVVVANPADVASMDAIIAALYDVISGPPGQQRDWNRFHSLLLPGARFIVGAPSGEGVVPARVMTAEQWIAGAEPVLMRDGFWERELSRRTERYGNVAHVFSTYDSRTKSADSAPISRGINSIQLLTDGTRWWVVNVLWDFERPGNPLPAEYLTTRPPGG